jgi:rod shape-determining protein MreD
VNEATAGLARHLRTPLFLAVVWLVEEGVLRGLRIDGVRPELLLAAAVVAGLVGGAERGAIVGFAAGLAADLFLPTPLGLSALVFCLTGYATGALETTIGSSTGDTRAPAAAITVGAASAVGVGVSAVVGTLVGLPGVFTPHLVTVVAVVSLVNAAVSTPLVKLARWTLSPNDHQSEPALSASPGRR